MRGRLFFHTTSGHSRSKLTILGIAIGVYSVFTIATIGLTGQELLNQELGKLGFDCITISATDKALNQLSNAELTYVSGLPEVALAAPLVTNFGQVSMRGFVGDTVVCGIDSNSTKILRLKPLYGRMLSKYDFLGQSRVCVVDESLAQAFYKRSNIVGKQMELLIDQRKELFTIVGVVSGEQSALTNLVGDYIPSFVYIPYTEQIQLTGRQAIDQIFVQLRSGTDSIQLGQAITTTLNRMAGYKNLYHASDLALQKDKLNRIFNGITLILAAIGAISLVVSGLSIMTIMTATVRERTKEIGIKKAIGAKRRDILIEFLGEALFIALKGSFVGLLLSIITVIGVQWVANTPVVFSYPLAAATLLFSLLIGGIFGVAPALSAAKLKPVDALRYEI